MMALDGDDDSADGHVGARVASDIFLGDYNLGFAVLPGDFNGNGVVDSTDLVGIRNQLQGTGDSLLAIWADLDGNGVVDLDDYNAARKKVGKKL